MRTPISSKKPPFKKHPLAVAIHIACGAMLGGLPLAHAAPTGGAVVGGSGTINQSGLNTTINQATQYMAINWQSYNLKSNERVRYIQPNASSISLNRILSNNGSTIAGRIDANGKVILVNPNGIFFTSTASLNVGSLIASGLDINPNDFMSGKYIFNEIGGTSGTVVNQGLINASMGGNVALIGKQVKNEGLITANLGTVTLAAGKEAVLTFDNDGLLGVRITKEILQSELGVDPAVINSGEIQAQGGRVLLTASQARDVFSRAVNTGGMEQATSVVVNDDGTFSLGGGADVLNSGTINTSAAAAGQNGGRIALIGENVTSSGTLKADAASGNGGEIELHARDKTLLTQNSLTSARSEADGKGGLVKVLGDKVGLFDHTTVDVSGANGGGQALIGGDFQGKNPLIRNASKTIVAPGSAIYADALNQGDGGKIIVWADDYTRFYGNIYARGGDAGGNGGFAEVSGKAALDFEGMASLTASQGKQGTLLLDPLNLTICSGCTSTGSLPDGYNEFTDATNTESFLSNTTLANLLSTNGATVYLLANNDITVAADISSTVSAGNAALVRNLTLYAGRSIFINNNITIALDGANFTAVVNYTSGSANGDNPLSRQTGPAIFSMGLGSSINTRGGDIGISSGNYGAPGVNVGNFTLRNLNSSGVDGVAGTGQSGTDAGTITVTNAIGNIDVLGQVEARGGNGAGNSSNGGTGGNGGAGGNINIEANSGTITVGAVIQSNGGNGGNGYSCDTVNVGGDSCGAGGNGRDAGRIDLTVGNNLLVNASIAAIGGAAGLGGFDAGNGVPGAADGSAGASNTINMVGDSSANIFTLNDTAALLGANVTLDGNGNTDRLVRVGSTGNAWTISSGDAGQLVFGGTTVNFSDIDSLTGGAGVDSFNITTGSLSGMLDGGTNGASTVVDTLQIGTSGIDIQLGSRTDAQAVSDSRLNVTGVETITASTGSVASNLVFGDNVNAGWTINGANAAQYAPTGAGPEGTTQLNNFGSVTGGSGNDTFTISGGTLGSINGGGGVGINTLTYLGHAVNGETITLGNGTLAVGANTMNYSGMRDITVDGQGGVDTIILSGVDIGTGTLRLAAETVTGGAGSIDVTANTLVLDTVNTFGGSGALIDTSVTNLNIVNSSPLVYINELLDLGVTMGPGGVGAGSIFRVVGTANINAGGSNLVLDAAQNDFDTVNISNAASIVLGDRDEIQGGSMTAGSITLRANNGINLTTTAARLDITNAGTPMTPGGQRSAVTITNNGTTTASITNTGDINLTVNGGNLIVERIFSNGGNYQPSPFAYIGDVNITVQNGSIRAYSGSPSYGLPIHTAEASPDIVAQNLRIIAGIGVGLDTRPLSLRVQGGFTYSGPRGYVYYYGARPYPIDDGGSLVSYSSLDNLDSLRLLEVESLGEFDPAIFGAVRNYSYEDIALLMPSDQRLDATDEDEDGKEKQKGAESKPACDRPAGGSGQDLDPEAATCDRKHEKSEKS